MTAPREVAFELPTRVIRGLEWGTGSGPIIVALHGWLDNSASFGAIFETLVASGLNARLIALDLAGHGRSDHRDKDALPHFVDAVVDLFDVIDQLDAERVHLLGHSMGAGIATLAAGTLPDRVASLLLFDGLGPLSLDAEAAPAQLARAITRRKEVLDRAARDYPTREAMAKRALGNNSGLTEEAVRRLHDRGTISSGEGFRFTFDPRLRGASFVRLTEAQVLAFVRNITAPTLVLWATDGWHWDVERVKARAAALTNAEVLEVEGGHHVHLTHPERVEPHVRRFLSEQL